MKINKHHDHIVLAEPLETDVFQAVPDEANKDLNLSRECQFLICDNASWHKANRLRRGGFEPVFLPAYSPAHNPIERLWLVIKAQRFADFIAKDREALTDRHDQSLAWAIDRGLENKTPCSIETEI